MARLSASQVGPQGYSPIVALAEDGAAVPVTLELGEQPISPSDLNRCYVVVLTVCL
jgi:hypothetical protein